MHASSYNNNNSYLEDSDDENDFWTGVGEDDASELQKKLSNGDLDKVPTARIVVSEGEMLLAITEFISFFELPFNADEKMCQMINSFLSYDVLPNTRHKLDKLLRSNDSAEYHAVCLKCNIYLRTFHPSERRVLCEKCQTNVEVIGNEVNFFTILNIEKKVRDLLEANEQYYINILNDNQNPKVSNTFEDIYDGLKYKKFIRSLPQAYKNSYVTGIFNSDGSPVFKSSSYAMWPIQLILNELPQKVRFDETITCAIWYGSSKPNMDILMRAFINKIEDINLTGIPCTINGGTIYVRLFPICCCVDTVARAPMQGLVQFNGKFGCNWCYHPGVPVKQNTKKVIKYPLLDYLPDKRTHVDFLKDLKTSLSSSSRARGVKGQAALIESNCFDIVDGFVPDDLHIKLGIGRQFLHQWVDVCRQPYSIKQYVGDINELFKNMQVPEQIGRLTRTLKDRKHWKALEHENWIAFLSLPILKTIPNLKKYLEHWELFVEATHIMKSKVITLNDLDKLNDLNNNFVSLVEKYYSAKAMTYNVHQISHMADSVKNWGPIFVHDGYPFESGNGKIVRTVKGAKGVIHQICRSIEYKDSAAILKKHISEGHENSAVINFCHQLKNRYTAKSIKILENRYFGKSRFTGEKWINLHNLTKNYIKSYDRMVKDQCLFTTNKKQCLRSNNSFAQDKNGMFINIVEFIVDEYEEKEYTLCKFVETETVFKNCTKIRKIVKINEEIVCINTHDISNIAVYMEVVTGNHKFQYISAVPNMLKH